MLQLWIKHLRGNEHVRRSAWQAMLKGKQNARRIRRVAVRLPRCWATSNGARLSPTTKVAWVATIRFVPSPFIAALTGGCDSVIEFTAVRKPCTQAEVRRVLEAEIAPALADSAYNYHTPLRRYPQPSPATDLVNNCDQSLVQRMCRQARTLDRVAELRRLFARITAGSNDRREQVLRCLTFAQRQFYHHFAGHRCSGQTCPCSIRWPV